MNTIGHDQPSPVSAATRQSFGRNVSWAAIGGVAYAAGNWVQLAALTKLVSPTEVGLFAFALALSAPILILAGLGLRTIQVTDSSGAYVFGDYLTLRIITLTLGVAAVLAIAIFGSYGRAEVIAVLGIAIAKAIDSISDLYFGAFQRAEQLDRPAKAQIINATVSTTLTIVAVLLTEQVLWACVAVASGSIVALVTYVLPTARDCFSGETSDAHLVAGLRPRWSPRRLLDLTYLSAPLGFAYLLMALNANLPRYVVESSLGRRELGIFASMASVIVIGVMVMAPLAQAALPRVTVAYARGDRRAFGRTLGFLLAFALATGTVAIALAVVVGDTVVGFVFSDAYTGQGDLLTLMTAATAISAVIYVLDVGLSAAQRFRVQLSANLMAVLVTFGVSVVLVPRLGLEGAGWAICVSLTVQAGSKAVSLFRAASTLDSPTRTPTVATHGGPPVTVTSPVAASAFSVPLAAPRDAGPRPPRSLGGRPRVSSGVSAPLETLPMSISPYGGGVLAVQKSQVKSHSRDGSSETTNVLVAAALCLVVLVVILLGSDQVAHWFVLPVYLSGVLIGRDAVRWYFGGCDLLDPVGLLGLLGLHFFFLVPLLHVSTGHFLRYVDPPDDWRVWLGKMALINLAGISCYQLGRSLLGRAGGRQRYSPTIWRADPNRLTTLLIGFMVLSAVLQAYVYFRFGGIGGYIRAFSSAFSSNAFEGLGLLYMFSEALPILAVFLYAFWTHQTGRGTSVPTICAVLIAFFVATIFFGGLRGSRSNFVWPAFWSLGLIHLWVRPIGRRSILTGAALFVFFMYGYAYYKNYGTDAIGAVRGEVFDANRDRSFEQILIGDLGRSDVQAFLLYQLSQESGSDYQVAFGRTYVGAVSVIIPKRIWPGRPEAKAKEGTEALYGSSGFPGTTVRSSHAYGLGGETMLNFGPWAVPFAYFLFGVGVGAVQRWRTRIPSYDARTLLVPFVVSLCVFVLVWDSDVTFYYVVTSGVVPALVLWLSIDHIQPTSVRQAVVPVSSVPRRPAVRSLALRERANAT